MYAAFPSLDHTMPAPAAATPPARLYAGDGPRTAGPMPGRYVADSQQKNDHSAFLNTPESGTSEGWGFGDVLDVINPLQHIPLVNMVYRGLTGDQIGGAAQIIGGGLFGGPIGAIAGTASAIISHQTGQSPAEVVVSAFNGDAPPARAAQAYVDLSAPPVKRYNFHQKA
jgi:hypothetical protein